MIYERTTKKMIFGTSFPSQTMASFPYSPQVDCALQTIKKPTVFGIQQVCASVPSPVLLKRLTDFQTLLPERRLIPKSKPNEKGYFSLAFGVSIREWPIL